MYSENQSPDVKGGNVPRDEVVARRSKGMEALKGKVAVITGGSSGIGLATSVPSLRERSSSSQDGDKPSWIEPQKKSAGMS